MYLQGKRTGEYLAPLERVTLVGVHEGTLVVRDSLDREYVRVEATPIVHFIVGGTPGYHKVILENLIGVPLDTTTFRVDAQTQISDQEGEFRELLLMLKYTMFRQGEADWSEGACIRYQGRIYRFFVRWLRDHVHVLKGMKYFADYLKDGIDLYRDSQRQDGMIWDNVYPRTKEPNYWDERFREGDFIRPFEDYTAEFKRIPVESDVEYLFVEGLYYTWKAVGDDAWMIDSLDAAIKALEYSVTSPYRWSSKYQLLKRGYTIDTWDFQNVDDSVVAHDAMRIDPQKTHFGIMFGDNTGYAAACRYLAEMLEYAGRSDAAAIYRQREQDILQRLKQVSWNGGYFVHHVPEETGLQRDLGVDELSQISLSNAYSLNRGIAHDQCVAIINTYRHLKEHLPSGSPAEWYTIYPPFQKGFGDHNGIWQYMNGSVTPIVAGELAHGAFEHGFEQYGVDILRRLSALGKKYDGVFHSSYTGAFPEPPVRNFIPIDISALANIDVVGEGTEGVPGWIGEGKNDLHEMPSGEQEFADVPFLLPDPVNNGRRACIGLRQCAGYAPMVDLSLNAKAASIYFLHTASKMQTGGVGGTITLHYADGGTYSCYVINGQNTLNWWLPEHSVTSGPMRIAWRGKNAFFGNIGVVAYGLDNPYPEREITHMTLKAAEDGAFWAVLGVTLCDAPVYFKSDPISTGIPDSWGAAAVVYALIEGLVGIVDSGTGYSEVTVAPRWSAAGTTDASALVKYPASSNYVAYRYHHEPKDRYIEIEITGSGEKCFCHILLPGEATEVISVTVADKILDVELVRVEKSLYADFTLSLPVPQHVTILYTTREDS